MNYASFLRIYIIHRYLKYVNTFFETSKYLNKFELINKFTKEQQKDYIKLPRKVS